MKQFFHMDPDMFTKWQDTLIANGYDWKQMGISNDVCNRISVPNYGLRLIDWQDQAFEIVNKDQYLFFLLRCS